MTAPVRVLHINKYYWPHRGGMERYLRDLAREQARRGMNVTVLVCNESPRTAVHMDGDVRVIRVARFGRVSSSPFGPGLLLWLRRVQADVHHLHHPFPSGELAYLAVGRDPAVLTWQSDIVRQRWLLKLYRPFLERLLARARVIMPTSPQYLSSSPFLQGHREKCRVVPLGLDFRGYEGSPAVLEAARQVRARLGSPLLLFVGRLVSYKGIPVLIEALTRMRTAANLALVGSGPLGPLLERIARQAGVAGRVHFIDSATDEELRALYHACDALVLPSVDRTESFGLVQLEAMACGRPVISTALPTGVPFVNLDGQTGFVVTPGDADALAGALDRILRSGSEASEMGARARARVLAEFGIERAAAEVASVYLDAVGPRRSNSSR